MDTQIFDAIVIGSGPGGYPAAIRLAQHGKSVALVEAGQIGGTCLNRGCIPTKALLSNAEVLNTIKHAHQWGINTGDVTFDFAQMTKRKDDVVSRLRSSLEGLIAGNGVTIIRGRASFIGPYELKIEGSDSRLISARDIIIASGSEPKNIPAFPFDGKHIHSSTSILQMDKLPKSLTIIGGGVIGCEFASLYAELGVKITIVEMLDRIIPLECPTLSSALGTSFQKRGITLSTKSLVKSVIVAGSGVVVTLDNGQKIESDMALVAIGRSLNSDRLGLDRAGVQVEKGAIVVDDRMQTSVSHVWAIGDVTAKTMYAHVATHQGLVAAENILGHAVRMNYDAVPGVIFTHPEIASVGLTLDESRRRGLKAIRSTYPLQALGKAQASLQTEGFAQLVTEEGTQRILGAQVIGYEAGNLISAITTAIANEHTVESIIETIHAHPTLSEVWLEAAFISQGMPLHFPKSAVKRA